tara:strand:+ start:3898 stop:4308 length:411 start_codon:yes stop_codon:yes gene_type:complete
MFKIIPALKNALFPLKPYTHSVFYFPMDGVRMGINSAHFLALPLSKSQNVRWRIYDEFNVDHSQLDGLAVDIRDGLADIEQVKLHQASVDMRDPVLERCVVNGEKPLASYVAGDKLHFPGGGLGYALGQFKLRDEI